MSPLTFSFRSRAVCLSWVMLGMALTSAPLLDAEEKPATGEPSRREVWVPSKDLKAILKKHPNAVLLDRAQYEALIRDAGRVKPDEQEPPVPSVIEGVKLRVELSEGAPAAVIHAKVAVFGLSDEWSEVTLLDLPRGVVLAHFDGENVSPQTDATNDRFMRLLVRGKGRHEVVMQFRAPIERNKGVCQTLVPHLAKPFAISVAPSERVVLPSQWPVKDGIVEVPLFQQDAEASATSLYWLEGAATSTTQSTLVERADSLVSVRGNEIETFHRVTVESSNGPLPRLLRLQLGDATVQVTRVGWWGKGDAPFMRASESGLGVGGEQGEAAWKQEGAVLELTRRESYATQAEFFFVTSKPTPLLAQTTTLPIDVPRLEGAARITLNVGLSFHEGLEMVSWQTPGSAPPEDFVTHVQSQRNSGANDDATFLTHYESAPAPVVVNVRRASDLYSADVDLQALVTQHELQLTRTILFHGEEGGVGRAVFTLPAGEQFLNLMHASGQAIEWKQTVGTSPALEITWPVPLARGKETKVLLSTRKDLPAAGPNPPPLVLENLAIPGAARVAGYLALDFDESWNVTTPGITGLESRDARFSPVKGRMAWFHLRDFRLSVILSRHEPVMDAAIVAYALPRTQTVEIEGQLTVEVTRAPLRTFSVKLPVHVAPLLRWDSPLIGERTLDAATGVWTLSFRKELLGRANLRWHLSQPGEVKKPAAEPAAPDAEAKSPAPPAERAESTTLTAVLASFAVPTARRFTGAWVIEANTDTELSFVTKGLQVMDALSAPRVEGYAPRHRVLAAYGYGSVANELRVTATRHESTRLTSAVVEVLSLTSVLARDGTARHEALMRVRHSGDQFFAIRLPDGATLLSTAVENTPTKPVSAGAGEVRVPLPRRQGGNDLALVSVLYETRAATWGGSGKATLQPPAFDATVPVLTTSWKVHAPDGYSYVDPETTLDTWRRGTTPALAGILARPFEGVLDFLAMRMVDFAPGGFGEPMSAISDPRSERLYQSVDEMLFANSDGAKAPARGSLELKADSDLGRDQAQTRYYVEKMQKIIFPQLKFHGASIEEAVEYVRIKSRDYDITEGDPARRGIGMILKPGVAPSTAKITLDLKNVSMAEALKYITELAGMKYRIDPFAVVISPLSESNTELYKRTFKVPPDIIASLIRSGGAVAAPVDPFAPADATRPGLGARPSAIDILKANGIQFPHGANATFNPATSQLVVTNTQLALDQIDTALQQLGGNDDINLPRLNAKSGVLPVKLELPATGRVFSFRGHEKPEPLALRYSSWERQMTKACFWLLVGLAGFYCCGRQRTCWRTFLMVLVLTCVPLALLPAWLPMANALLVGWFIGLGVWLLRRLARWVERTGNGQQEAGRVLA